MPAGAPDAEGTVAESSVNFRVAARLAEMSRLRHEFGTAEKPGRSRNAGGTKAG